MAEFKAGDKETVYKNMALKAVYETNVTCKACGAQLTWFVGNVEEKEGATTVTCKGACPKAGDISYAVQKVIIDDFGEILEIQKIRNGNWHCADSTCFITTAICQAREDGEDCYELDRLRGFRDG